MFTSEVGLEFCLNGKHSICVIIEFSNLAFFSPWVSLVHVFITSVFQMHVKNLRHLSKRNIKRTKKNTRPRKSIDGRKRRWVTPGCVASDVPASRKPVKEGCGHRSLTDLTEYQFSVTPWFSKTLCFSFRQNILIYSIVLNFFFNSWTLKSRK